MFGNFPGFVEIRPRPLRVATYKTQPRSSQKASREEVNLSCRPEARNRFFDSVLGFRDRLRDSTLQKRPIQPSAPEAKVIEGDWEQWISLMPPIKPQNCSPLNF